MIIHLPVRKLRPYEIERAEGMTTKIGITTKEESAASHLQNDDEGIVLIEACLQSQNYLMALGAAAINTNGEIR